MKKVYLLSRVVFQSLNFKSVSSCLICIMYSRLIREHCIVIQVIENLSKCSSCDTCGALCTLLNQLHNRLNQAEKEILELC